MLWQLQQRGQRTLSLLAKLRDSEITEFARNLLCVQEQTSVCGGDSGCNGRRFLLNVIGDKPVMFLGAEVGKIAPDMERGLAQESQILPGYFRSRSQRRSIQPY